MVSRERINSLRFERYLTRKQRLEMENKVGDWFGSRVVRVLNAGDHHSLLEIEPPVARGELHKVFTSYASEMEQRTPAQPVIQTSRS